VVSFSSARLAIKGPITRHVEAEHGCQHEYLITDAATICVVGWMVRSASW
jgi:hypothetical protein